MADQIYNLFVGGLNLQDDPRLLPKGESPNAINVYGGDTGTLRPRKGTSLNTSFVSFAGSPHQVVILAEFIPTNWVLPPQGITGSTNSIYDEFGYVLYAESRADSYGDDVVNPVSLKPVYMVYNPAPDFVPLMQQLSDARMFVNGGADDLSWPARVHPTPLAAPTPGTDIPLNFYQIDYLLDSSLMLAGLQDVINNYNSVKNSYLKDLATLTAYGGGDDYTTTPTINNYVTVQTQITALIDLLLYSLSAQTVSATAQNQVNGTSSNSTVSCAAAKSAQVTNFNGSGVTGNANVIRMYESTVLTVILGTPTYIASFLFNYGELTVDLTAQATGNSQFYVQLGQNTIDGVIGGGPGTGTRNNYASPFVPMDGDYHPVDVVLGVGGVITSGVINPRPTIATTDFSQACPAPGGATGSSYQVTDAKCVLIRTPLP